MQSCAYYVLHKDNMCYTIDIQQTELLDALNLFKEKLVDGCADGAAVKLSCRNGMLVNFKEKMDTP